MTIQPQDHKQVEVSFKFYLPDNQEELEIFQKALEYHCTLSDIYNKCRSKWKYDDNASEELVAFAEEIGKMAWLEE